MTRGSIATLLVAGILGGILLSGSGCGINALDPNSTLASALQQLAQDANQIPALNQITVGNLVSALQSAPAAGTGATTTGAAPMGHVVELGGQLLLARSFNAAPLSASFTADANQPVTVTVASDNAASRVTLAVTDASNNTVATTASPTTYVSQATFTPAAAGTFTLTATETGTAATLYTVWVAQEAAAPPTPEPPVLLLTQTFAAAPFTATFTPTASDRLIRVVAAGDNGSSRLSVQVADPNGVVVASVTNATTNVATTTFNSAGTGAYTVTVTDTGSASTTYVVHVQEAGTLPFGGEMHGGFGEMGHGWRGWR